jgi:smad nuclear-interacting protein 1
MPSRHSISPQRSSSHREHDRERSSKEHRPRHRDREGSSPNRHGRDRDRSRDRDRRKRQRSRSRSVDSSRDRRRRDRPISKSKSRSRSRDRRQSSKDRYRDKERDRQRDRDRDRHRPGRGQGDNHHRPTRVKDESDSDANTGAIVKRSPSHSHTVVTKEKPSGIHPSRQALIASSSRRRSRSPPPQRHFDRGSGPRPSKPLLTGSNNDHENFQEAPLEEMPEPEKPNLGTTGKLAAESNTVNGVVLKYAEPSEGRKPPAKESWRLFVFKDGAVLETLDLGTRSMWLVGRDRSIVDIPAEHPSCSAQHAVVQFRQITKTDEYGDRSSAVK